MKGATLNIKILTYLALASFLVACLLAYRYSLSELAWTKYDFLLYLTLGSVFGAFLLRSVSHPKGNEWNWFWRNRQWNRITAYSFLAIAATSVVNDWWIIEPLHLLATGIGITSGYIQMLGYKHNKVGRILSYIGTGIGVGGFLVGFLTPQYSITIGEAIAAVPLAMWVLLTNEK